MILMNVSAGEACDKFTILQIKCERIEDEAKLAQVQAALATIQRVMKEGWIHTDSDKIHYMLELTEDLKKVNEALWTLEDAVRASLAEEDADRPPVDDNILLAFYKEITTLNDDRAKIKRSIDKVVEDAGEVKSYDDQD